LEKILRANRAEVIAVSIFEYNKEEEEQKLRKAEYEAGVAEGELKKARETALSLAEMGLPVDKIAEAVKISRDKVEEWMKESMSIV
jgi:transposase-like protein